MGKDEEKAKWNEKDHGQKASLVDLKASMAQGWYDGILKRSWKSPSFSLTSFLFSLKKSAKFQRIVLRNPKIVLLTTSHYVYTVQHLSQLNRVYGPKKIRILGLYSTVKFPWVTSWQRSLSWQGTLSDFTDAWHVRCHPIMPQRKKMFLFHERKKKLCSFSFFQGRKVLQIWENEACDVSRYKKEKYQRFIWLKTWEIEKNAIFFLRKESRANCILLEGAKVMFFSHNYFLKFSWIVVTT